MDDNLLPELHWTLNYAVYAVDFFLTANQIILTHRFCMDQWI